jgi:hypothetical protein
MRRSWFSYGIEFIKTWRKLEKGWKELLAKYIPPYN